MKKIILTTTMLFIICIHGIQSQTHFSFRIGGVSPSGLYADASGDYDNGVLFWGLMDNSTKGGAGIGFMGGIQINYNIKSAKGLGIILSLDGMYNPINSEIKDYFEDYIEDNTSVAKEVSIKLPQYINVPIMAGFNYTYNINDNFGIFAEAAIGANLRIITNMVQTLTMTNNEVIRNNTYNNTITLAYRFGAGLQFNGRYTIGIDYYNLGLAKAEGITHTEVNGNESNTAPKFKAGKITPTMVTLRLGINF